jgi:hypothetical protein
MLWELFIFVVAVLWHRNEKLTCSFALRFHVKLNCHGSYLVFAITHPAHPPFDYAANTAEMATPTQAKS